MNVTEKIYYKTLANYFACKLLYLDEPIQKKPNIRKLVEQPFQQTKAQQWDEVTDTLCNLDFIQAKAAAKMTYDLVRDCNSVLEVIPDNNENINEEKEQQKRLDKYARDLVLYDNGEISSLEVAKSIPPWNSEKMKAVIQRIKGHPTRSDRLNDFKIFLGHEVHNLQNYAHEFSHFATQQAWNYSDTGPVGKSAEEMAPNTYNNLLLYNSPSRPQWIPISQTINILNGHTNWVTTVAITPDGRKAISGSFDKTCILWDINTGKPIHILKGHPSCIISTAISADGKKAISSDMNLNCFVWDLNSGQAINIFKDFTSIFGPVAISPNGKKAITGSKYKTCILWEVNTGKIIRTLEGHTGPIRAVAITSDFKKAISGSEDKMCILWDLNSGKPIHILKGHSDYINTVAITPDGKKAISGSEDKTCILWDLTTGKVIKILKGHSDRVNSVAITPDGRSAISSSGEKFLIFPDAGGGDERHPRNHVFKIWDLISGTSITSFKSHFDEIMCVDLTSNGMKAISAAKDKRLIIWNVNSMYSFNIQNIYTEKSKNYGNTNFEHEVIYNSTKESNNLWNRKKEDRFLHANAMDFYIYKYAISSDCKKILLADCKDHPGILWDLDTGLELCALKEYFVGITSLAITPNCERAISSIGHIQEFNNGILKQDGRYRCIIWDLTNGSAIKSLNGHTDIIRSLLITPDGKKAISNSDDNTHIIWDLNEGKLIYVIKAQSNDGTSHCTLTEDGRWALSCPNDNKFIIGDINTGNVIYTLKPQLRASNLEITPDGRKGISNIKKDEYFLWDLRTGITINSFKLEIPDETVEISYDKSKAYSISKNTCFIWDFETKKKIGFFVAASEIEFFQRISGGFLIALASGKISILRAKKELIYPKEGIVTIRRIWDFELQKYHNPVAFCPICKNRFEPQSSILATVESITKKAGLRPYQSPCLELPDKAWEDPGLLGNCPKCRAELKFNPFIAGGDN